jgi:hypothetical protein
MKMAFCLKTTLRVMLGYLSGQQSYLVSSLMTPVETTSI